MAERAGREPECGVRPLRHAALVAGSACRTSQHQLEELTRGRGATCARERAPDIDARVVVGAADARRAPRLRPDRCRLVDLVGPGSVSSLPEREEIGQAPQVGAGERLLDGRERVGERASDTVLAEVGGARLDVRTTLLKPQVIVARDVPAEDVDGPGLSAKASRELD